MPDGTQPRLNRMPFWFADAILLLTAGVLVWVGGRPLSLWSAIGVVFCAGLGAWFAVLPLIKEYESSVRIAEAKQMAADASGFLEKLGDLRQVAERIGSATSQWQGIHDKAVRAGEMSKEVVERLSREAEGFAQVVSRTADSEKQTLKLEVEKLRRGEAEWLQAVGRVMDHVFALHLAAVRSGQPGVLEQVDRFHGACREALRRIGFVPIVAAPGERFDPRKHQVPEGPKPTEGALIDETVASGYVYQGQLLRPIIVRVQTGAGMAGTDATKAINAAVPGAPEVDRGEGATVSATSPSPDGANAS